MDMFPDDPWFAPGSRRNRRYEHGCLELRIYDIDLDGNFAMLRPKTISQAQNMPLKILGVDDNEVICFVVAGALKPYDCTVCQATDGLQGLAMAIREKPDLIILDISMPGMDGIEMLAQLRAKPGFAETSVIMLTAWSGQERLLQAQNLGVRDYLVKPFTKPQLIKKVSGIVSLRPKTGVATLASTSMPSAKEVAPVSVANSNQATANCAYGLSVPETVLRLSNLVARQEVDLAEMAEVIREDGVLSARLLRTANNRRREDDDEITTVEEALTRNGIRRVFLLTMGDLVMRALLKTIHDMAGIQLKAVARGKVQFPIGTHVLCEVGFSGKTLGKIDLHIDQSSATAIASRMLGLPPAETFSSQQIDSVFREMTNIVVGNFLSNLSDAGLQSQLSAPRIMHTREAAVLAVSGGIAERLAFSSAEATVFLDISIDPWNERVA
jgi:CheY-like chemotaxis protein/CheY-specific phosphatase CheX